jgi:ABC-type multidrug transport system permease subunit
MIERTRSIAAAMLYIQNANVITSIPLSMMLAIFGAAVRLTEAPWCSVFHHFTE